LNTWAISRSSIRVAAWAGLSTPRAMGVTFAPMGGNKTASFVARAANGISSTFLKFWRKASTSAKEYMQRHLCFFSKQEK
jgi:hypothetical protein